MSLPTKANGAAFTSDTTGHWFADAIDAAKLSDECVLHGLRKTATRVLAEAGCTTPEIAAITGHKSLAEVERYTKAASGLARRRRF